VWDAPTYERFSELSNGTNPRDTLRDRFRDWVLEKFLFFPLTHNSDINCTGCGRCIEVCPAKIDFRKVVGNVRFE
jgi:ferredoxin